MSDSPTVLVVEYAIEGTERDEVECFVTCLRDAVAKLKAQTRFKRTVVVSESCDDISYDSSDAQNRVRR